MLKNVEEHIKWKSVVFPLEYSNFCRTIKIMNYFFFRLQNPAFPWDK